MKFGEALFWVVMLQLDFVGRKGALWFPFFFGTTMLTSKSFLSFNFFLPSFLKKAWREHVILNQNFNQKQVKMKRSEYPNNQKTTMNPNFF
jgi:hypothetical protein